MNKMKPPGVASSCRDPSVSGACNLLNPARLARLFGDNASVATNSALQLPKPQSIPSPAAIGSPGLHKCSMYPVCPTGALFTAKPFASAEKFEAGGSVGYGRLPLHHANEHAFSLRQSTSTRANAQAPKAFWLALYGNSATPHL